MLLEDFAMELDRPLRSLDILEDMIELMIEEDFRANKATEKVLALLYTLRCTIKSIQNLHEKYNNIIEKEYEKMRAAKAAI